MRLLRQDELTPAELVALRAAAMGLTAAETAAQNFKSVETVKSQRLRVILKFGARNMVHACVMAAEAGLVDSGSIAA